LGGKTKTKTSKTIDNLLFQKEEDYANLTPQEREELTKKMSAATKQGIANLFRNPNGGFSPGEIGV
jgi:hypothetical protein